MYRLLIADDEALEREGLEWIVRHMMPDTFQVFHAENGRIAIERAEEHRPHIVMLDINMPGIQGLDALREIKSRLPDAKFVLVTAYDYFAYAKEALSLGAKEYLLKPVKREQLVDVLKQLIEELEREKRQRADELELRHKVSQLLPLAENELALMLMVDHVVDAEAEQLSEWIGFPFDPGTAIVAGYPEQGVVTDKKKIYDLIRGFARTQGPDCIVSSFIEQHMAVFLREPPGYREDVWREECKQFGETLRALSERQLGIAPSVGIGSLRRGASGLRTSYFEAVFASTCAGRDRGVCHFDELKQGGSQAIPALAQGSSVRETAGRSYVNSVLQRIREEREKQTLTVLDRAKQYIEARFTEDLSLEEVADHVHLNAHYFSKIFKQQFGETFIDFLTRLRIDAAKALITAGELSLKEVCYNVGYKDPNYFSRVFKKVTGVTPTDYRQSK